MTNGISDRLDRVEQILERSMRLLGQMAENQRQIVQTQEQIIQNQEQQQSQIQVLVNAALNHKSGLARQDALIERLDAIIERLVYREGRGNGDQTQH
jgi:ABC-type transporter Mla subunit MlaD